MSFYEYTVTLSGYIIRQAKALEGHRLSAYMLYAVNSTDKNKMTIQKFLPLVTDKVEKAKEITLAERMALSEMAMERVGLIPQK